MRRISLAGPLILILVGVLLLVSNLDTRFRFLDILASYWPWILVIWGAIRLMELAIWSRGPAPLNPKGIRPGEWMLIVLICLAGGGLHEARLFTSGFPFHPAGLKMFGTTHDFNLDEQRVPAEGVSRLFVENLRGEVIVSGEDTNEIRVTGRESIRALTEAEAARVWKERRVSIERQGDRVSVRTNQEGVAADNRLASYLRISIPRSMRMEARGRETGYDVSQVDGNILLAGDRGDVRVKDTDGEVRVQLSRSGRIEVSDAKGIVAISSGRGDNLKLQNLQGPVTAAGSFSGRIEMRDLAKPVRIESGGLDFAAEAIPGMVSADRGRFEGDGLTGPLRISSESKDVKLRQFTGPLELMLMRGDASIEAGGKTASAMAIDVRRGKVELSLPESGAFLLDAETRKGEFENRSKLALTIDSSGPATRVRGGKTDSPRITVRTERLEIEGPHAEGEDQD